MSKRSNETALPPSVSQGTLAPVDRDVTWEEIGYRGPQVCRIVGISYRQLDYWARTELLTPSLAEAAGSGTQRRYSYRDLVALKVIKSLLDAGIALKTARVAIDYLRDRLGGDLATASLVLDGSRSVLALTGDDIIDLVRHGQGVLNIVPLGPVVAELDASIHDLDTGTGTDEVGAAKPANPAKPAPTRRRKVAGGD
jgi:DNA-binding transcriptional MerR regulator